MSALVRIIVARTAVCLSVLVLGIVLGASLVTEETAIVMDRDSACQAMATRADTLLGTYADAYAARGGENPDLAYWQTKMNEQGWDYVAARKKCSGLNE